MKKLIVLFFAFLTVIGCFAQSVAPQRSNIYNEYTNGFPQSRPVSVAKDSIFMKSGEKFAVKSITRIWQGSIWYVTKESDKEYAIDTALISPKLTKRIIKRDAPYVPYTTIEDEYYAQNHTKSEMDYKLGWVKYNLRKFYKEQQTSQVLTGVSFMGMFMAAAVGKENPDTGTKLLIASSLTSLVSYIVYLDSYKWIARASLETNLNQVSVKVAF